jgi:hypothetical protein
MLLLLLSILIILLSSIYMLTLETSWTISKVHTWTPSSKKHIKEVIRVEICILLLVTLLIIFLSSMLIIDSSLVRIIQASESCADLFESISGIWSSILVRMKLESKFFVRLLYLLFSSTFLQPQNLIIIFFCDHSLAPCDLYQHVLFYF